MIDWAAARLDYVTHHELTASDIAKKYGAHPVTIWRRAAQEHWTDERKTRARMLLGEVREKAVHTQAEELTRCNGRDLRLAEKLKTAVEQRLQSASALNETALLKLASVAATAQTIARLALGASTEIAGVDPYSKLTDEELQAELQRLGIEPTLQ